MKKSCIQTLHKIWKANIQTPNNDNTLVAITCNNITCMKLMSKSFFLFLLVKPFKHVFFLKKDFKRGGWWCNLFKKKSSFFWVISQIDRTTTLHVATNLYHSWPPTMPHHLDQASNGWFFPPPTFQNTLNVFIVMRSHNAAPRIIHALQLFMLLLTYSLQVNTFMQGWHHLS